MDKRTLNDIMEFDHVILVLEDGSIMESAEGVWAPDLYDGELHQPSWGPQWTLLNGYSGQHGYSGPLMHQSEFIGGGLERHIRETPGFWVALADYPSDGGNPQSWAVAFRPAK